MQMFLGNVLIINQVSDEWALVAELLLRQWHFVTLLMCFIPLFVACTFPCKSKVSFDILEMFHQGTQKELEFVEFYGFFDVPHLWLDSQDVLRDRKQIKYGATKVYSLTLIFLDASQYTNFVTAETYILCLFPILSLFLWLNYTDDKRASVSQLVNLKGNNTLLCYTLGKEYK